MQKGSEAWRKNKRTMERFLSSAGCTGCAKYQIFPQGKSEVIKITGM